MGHEGNAHLIAAAPDLLAFVNDVIRWWDKVGEIFYMDDDGLQCIIEDARGLKAKARGQSESGG